MHIQCRCLAESLVTRVKASFALSHLCCTNVYHTRNESTYHARVKNSTTKFLRKNQSRIPCFLKLFQPHNTATAG